MLIFSSSGVVQQTQFFGIFFKKARKRNDKVSFLDVD